MHSDDFPKHVIDHYEDPYHRGDCDHPTHRGEQISAGCRGDGEDSISIQLRVLDGIIQQAWFQGEGCIVSQAAASLLMERIEGGSLAAAESLNSTDLIRLLQLDNAHESVACCDLVSDALKAAISGLLDEDDGGPTFLGLNLGDEC